jgi:hypothetical protein
VNFEGGKFYRVKNFRLTVPPPAKPVRVVLAALGPEMLEPPARSPTASC